jgi:hypothetical protein
VLQTLRNAAFSAFLVGQQVTRLAAHPPKSRTVVPGKRHSSGIDPGDAVPPGVAVQEPAPLDAEAEIARENLEEKLGSE